MNTEKMALMHAILNNSKCDWAKHILNCLEYFINKVVVSEGDRELAVNVGYVFMISYMLKLKGVPLIKGSEIHPNAYLFKPSKKSKSFVSVSETSMSSRTPLQSLIEKKKRRKTVKQNVAEIPIHVPFDEHFGSNEPPLKRTKKVDEVTSTVELVGVSSAPAIVESVV